MTNPLVAQAHDTDKALAGTGVLSDLKTVSDGVFGDASALTAGVAGASSGLGLLGAAMAPLSTLASAGFGWLIEHFDFLEDALEFLTGDPAAIEAQAQTWRNVAEQVRNSAEQYGGQVAALPATWEGQGSDAYQGAAAAFGYSLQASAAGADGAAAAIEGAGVLVGVERGLIRDMISEFVGWLIVEAGVALAASWCTFGGSIAAFTGFAIGQGLRLASTIADRLSVLSTKLDELIQLVSRLNGSYDQLTGSLTQLANKVDTASASLARTADNAADLPARADARVENFIQETAPNAMRKAADGRLDIQQRTTERLADANIPGSTTKFREMLETTALSGQNYTRSYDPDAEVWRSAPIEDGFTWSNGDSIKAGVGTAKEFSEQVAEPNDEPNSTDDDSQPRNPPTNT